MTSYDAAETIALLHKVVESKGSDYIYPDEHYGSDLGCYYAKDGEPSCIVGHVLFELGVPVSSLTYSEELALRGDLSEGVISTLFETLGEKYGIYFTPAARHALSAAQATQDARFTWDEALTQAENAAVASLQGELTE